jgi:hypothetical protein
VRGIAVSDDAEMTDDSIRLQLGCYLGKTFRGVGDNYLHYHITTIHLDRPAQDREVVGVTCERCGTTLDVVVLSRGAVSKKLYLAPLLFVLLPGVVLLVILPCVLDSQGGLTLVGLAALAVALVGVWLAVRRMPVFNDWIHGKCGVAVEWWNDTRAHDYDPKEKDYRHVLWAAYPGGGTDYGGGLESDGPSPPTE